MKEKEVKMQMKKWFLVLALMLPLTAHAMCNCDEDEEEDDGEFRQYSYVGLKGGTNHVNEQSILMGSDTAYGIYGGTRYSKFFAVEVEYSYLGTFQTAAGTGHATAVSLAGVHQIEMGWADLIFKLGIAHTHTALTGSGNNQIDATFGAGLQFPINRDLDLRFGYDHYRLKLPPLPTATGANDSFAHIGISYRY